VTTITIKGDILAEIERVKSKLNPKAVAMIAARAVRDEMKQHLVSYGGSHPNKLGGTTTGYYQKLAGNTVASETQEGARVTTTGPGVNQRIYGGVITAKNGRYLAIPVDALAHGKSPRSMNLEPVIRYINGSPRMVALAEPMTGRRMFVMKESVRQAGDPAVVPSADRFEEVINDAVGKALA